MTPPSRDRGRDYLMNYGLGMILVAGVICCANFAGAASGNPAGGWLNVLCLAGYLAATAMSAVRIVRGTRWRALAWSWLTVILVLSAALRWALPPGQLFHLQDWSVGAFGFVAVVVLFGQQLAATVLAQLANCLIAVPVLIAGGQVNQETIVQCSATAVGISVFPIAAAVFHPQLRHIAELAGRDARARQQLLAREAKARQVALDRAHRSQAIESTVRPLLQALADGSADPQDPSVRRAARIESARLRRLFAEVDETDEPLLHEVRASMETVERIGVAVTLETRGQIPPLPVPLRRALLEAPMSTLASAATTARVVIMADPRAVSVSVVTDGSAGPDTHPSAPADSGDSTIRTSTTTADDVTWTQTSWTAPS